MPPETDATDPNKSARPTESASPANPDPAGTTSARPPRPEMSDRTPAPVLKPIVPSRQVKVARTLWIVSFASGSIAMLFAFVARDEQLERLRELVTELAPERHPDTLAALASLVFWGTLGLVALVIVVQAILLHGMMRGHGGVRWVLLFTLIVSAGIAVVADAVVIPPGDEGLYLRICLVAQLALAGAGSVLSLFPGASAWFRAQRKARHRPRG